MDTSLNHSALFRSMVVLLIGLVGYACNIAYTKLLTHNLSLELYGDFSVAWRSVMLVAQLITFGTGMSAMRFVSLYSKTKQPEKTQGFIYWASLLLLRTSFLLAVAYCIFWVVASITHLTDLHSFDQYHLAMHVIIFAPLLAISTIFSCLIMSHGYIMLSTIVGSLLNRVIQITTVFIFFNIFIPKEIYHLSFVLIAILFATMTISVLAYLWLPENELLNTLRHTKKHFVDESWIKVAQSSCLNSMMFTLSFTSDLYILEIFSPQENHVGIFSVCVACVGLLDVLQRSISNQSATAVMNVALMRPKARDQLQRSLDVFNIIKLILVVLSAITSWLFRVEIFTFFSIHQATPHLLLPIMFVNVYLLDTRYQFSYLMANKEMDMLNRTQILSTFMMISGAVILVEPYGLYGIAVATGLSRLYAKIALTLRCHQTCTMRFALFA